MGKILHKVGIWTLCIHNTEGPVGRNDHTQKKILKCKSFYARQLELK